MTMTLGRRLVATLLGTFAAGLLVVSATATQVPQAPDVLLKAASHKAQVEGDLEGALQIYKDLLARHGTDRALAAQVLLKMAECHQKLGHSESRQFYERLVREYGDQTDVARTARARLAVLTGSGADVATRGKASGPNYRLVLEDLAPAPLNNYAQAAPFDVSPDGTRIVFAKSVLDRGARRRLLYVADSGGSILQPLLDDPEARWNFGAPRWAPDGRKIAYLVHKTPYDAPGPWQIELVAGPGQPPRQIGPDFADDAEPQDLCWSADGRLTYLARDGIYTIGVEGGAPRRIQAMDVHFSMRLNGYSPDGRWLVFQRMRDGAFSHDEIDLWMLPAEGGRAVQLTRVEGVDAHATWSPDGTLYFVSTRGGDSNIWTLTVDKATGLGRGEPEQVTFFSDARVMYPRFVGRSRQIYFALTRGTTTIRVADAEHPDRAVTIARGLSPVLSSDGGSVYFVGQATDQRGIFSVPRAGGTPTPLASVDLDGGFDLSPAGRTLTYQVRESKTVTLFTLPVTGGTPRLLLRSMTTEPGAVHPTPRWSPDGSLVAFVLGDTLFVISRDGGSPTRLAQIYAWQEFLWSPDGRFIGAIAYVKPGDENIAAFVVPSAGGELQRLTPPDEQGYKEGLAWHPAGRLTYVLYTGPGGRQSAIREAYLDGRAPATVVRLPDHWDYTGRWSPDGRYFFFLSAPPDRPGFNLYRHDSERDKTEVFAQSVTVSPFSLAHGLVSWSRDQRVMVWAGSETFARQLWRMEQFR